MAKRLFVGGLPYNVDDAALNAMFAPFGVVLSATVIKDRFTNQSKGFGFVEMEDDKAADESIAKLNGTDVGGRNIAVNVARPMEERPPRRDFGGGGRRDFDRGGGKSFQRGGRDSSHKNRY